MSSFLALSTGVGGIGWLTLLENGACCESDNHRERESVRKATKSSCALRGAPEVDPQLVTLAQLETTRWTQHCSLCTGRDTDTATPAAERALGLLLDSLSPILNSLPSAHTLELAILDRVPPSADLVLRVGMDQRVVAEVLDVGLDARVLAVLLELLKRERIDQRVRRLGRTVLERRLDHGRAGVRIATVSADDGTGQLRLLCLHTTLARTRGG